jgi:hypothetical protein
MDIMCKNCMSTLEDLIIDVIPSQKCHKNIGSIANRDSYEYLKLKIHEFCNIEDSIMYFLYSVCFEFVYHSLMKVYGSQSGDRSGQFCVPP